MKTKYPSMFGLLAVFMLVASLMVPVLANPQPVEASQDATLGVFVIEAPLAVTIGLGIATGLSPPAIAGPDTGISLQATDDATAANLQTAQLLQDATILVRTDLPIIFNSTAGLDSKVRLQATDGTAAVNLHNVANAGLLGIIDTVGSIHPAAEYILQDTTGLSAIDFSFAIAPGTTPNVSLLQGFRLNHPPWITGEVGLSLAVALLLAGICVLPRLIRRRRERSIHPFNSSPYAGHTTTAHGTTERHTTTHPAPV